MTWVNGLGPIESPRNSIRDIILATDVSLAGGTRQLYQVPSIYDLYMTKITTTVISSVPKVVRLFNTPPGEHSALFHSGPNGIGALDFHANPVLLPPGTVFSLDTDILSGALQYHHTSVWGILLPTDPNNWG